MMRLAFQNFLYNCDNCSANGVMFWVTLLELRDRWVAVELVGGECLIDWMGNAVQVIDESRWVYVQLRYARGGLVNRWKRAEHMTARVGQLV